MRINVNGFVLCVPSHAQDTYTRMCAREDCFVCTYGVGTMEFFEVPDSEPMRRRRFDILKARMRMGEAILVYDRGDWGVIADVNALHEFCRVPRISARMKRGIDAENAFLAKCVKLEEELRCQREFSKRAIPPGVRHKVRKPKYDAAGDHATHRGTFITERHYENSYAHPVFYHQVCG